MTIHVTPEIGAPYYDDIPYKDLKARADAACNTISELIENGLTIEVTDEDREVAATIATAYAKDPEQTSKKITNKRVGQLRPASLVLVGNILDEFGQSVVESANHIRHLVTNKLLLGLRALELLGKISDVSLFAEKTEVTVTHRSTDELRDVLRSKLTKLINPEDIIDVTPEMVDD
jgi:hypothetical protein